SAYEQSKATLGENAEETKRLKSELDSLEQEYAKNEEKIRSNSGDKLLNEAVKAGGNVILQDALPRVSKRSGKLKDGLKVSGVK
ncbi:hypothetical protein D1N71_20990, partial [Clostridioides difficile]